MFYPKRQIYHPKRQICHPELDSGSTLKTCVRLWHTPSVFYDGFRVKPGMTKVKYSPIQKQQGFTLLELLITIMIIGALFVVGANSGMTNWNKKKSSQNIYKELTHELATIRNHSMSKNVTTRINIINTDGIYTLNTFVSNAAVSTCSSTGTWNVVVSKPIDVHTAYQITGTGMADTCFYRDGSSSGGTFIVSPITSGEGTTYTITITIATGYFDVTES